MTDDDKPVTNAGTPARRRTFVARGSQPSEPSIAPSPPPAPPPAPAPEPEFEDIPVLTEVFVAPVEATIAVAEQPAPPEPPEPEIPSAPPEPPPPPEPPEIPQEMVDARAMELLQAQLPFQRQAVADELANWLDTELPQVVLHIIDGVTDHLIAKVTEEARAALLPKLQEALEPDNISLDDEG